MKKSLGVSFLLLALASPSSQAADQPHILAVRDHCTNVEQKSFIAQLVTQLEAGGFRNVWAVETKTNLNPHNGYEESHPDEFLVNALEHGRDSEGYGLHEYSVGYVTTFRANGNDCDSSVPSGVYCNYTLHKDVDYLIEVDYTVSTGLQFRTVRPTDGKELPAVMVWADQYEVSGKYQLAHPSDQRKVVPEYLNNAWFYTHAITQCTEFLE